MKAECMVYRVDGTTEKHTPHDGVQFSLEELQGFVGGHVEIVASDGSNYVLGDEEGRLKGKPINSIISWACGKTLVGDCVVIKKEFFE